MIKPERKPEVVDAVSLNKYLMGISTQIATKEVTVEQVEAVSKIADKIIKLNLVRLMYKKSMNYDSSIEFFEGDENKLLLVKKPA